MGFTYDFNIHEDDIVKIQAIMKFNIFIDTKAIVIQMMKQLFMASNQLRVKGVFVAGYAANSENGAARVLIDLTIKIEILIVSITLK
jgi:hypothetical protein